MRAKRTKEGRLWAKCSFCLGLAFPSAFERVTINARVISVPALSMASSMDFTWLAHFLASLAAAVGAVILVKAVSGKELHYIVYVQSAIFRLNHNILVQLINCSRS